MASLLPQTWTPAIIIADVNGVSVSGLVIDAGTVNPVVELQASATGLPMNGVTIYAPLS